MDAGLKFKLLVVSDEHVPTISAKHLSTGERPTEILLESSRLDELSPDRIIRGRVIDADGKPIPNAIVEPDGVSYGRGIRLGIVDGIDALALTNIKGEFRIGTSKPAAELHAKVIANGFVKRDVDGLVPDNDNKVRLEEGVTVTGRVLREGKPFAGIGVGVMTESHGFANQKMNTDQKGRFRFCNLKSDDNVTVYGLMDSCKEYGAIKAIATRSNKSGSTLDFGDIDVESGFRISGKLRLSDGMPLPSRIRIMLGRDEAWDFQQIEISRDGSFEFDGVPPELCYLAVRVRGYRLSKENVSLDVANPFRLIGTVEGNVENLDVLFEPGAIEPRNGGFDYRKYEKLKTSPFRGVE